MRGVVIADEVQRGRCKDMGQEVLKIKKRTCEKIDSCECKGSVRVMSYTRSV